ncbi:flavodoxin [Stomatohabitans albus]|uniref:flavodoxin family protein n=1 Tax=Stomatohabitans albus TaxID=3110766 RepID=UPI00300CA33C
MKALIVCESWFGNAYTVAEHISQGLGAQKIDTAIVRAQDAPDVVGVEYDLLIVGAPTHGGGLSTPSTRADAMNEGGDTGDMGVSEWLDTVTIAESVNVAAFTTMVDDSDTDQTAAHAIAIRISERFPGKFVELNRFLVEESHGPLAFGEGEAAGTWGHSLANSLY